MKSWYEYAVCELNSLGQCAINAPPQWDLTHFWRPSFSVAVINVRCSILHNASEGRLEGVASLGGCQPRDLPERWDHCTLEDCARAAQDGPVGGVHAEGHSHLTGEAHA